MASRAQRSCLWMLILGACVSLVVGAECGKECALCLYHARGHQSALACSLECQGVLDSQRLRLCQDFLFEEENGLSLDADPSPQQDQEAVGAMTHDDEETLDDLENQDEEENIRLEILKIISAAGDHGGEEDSHGGEVVKRYGGFMRRDEGGVAPADLLKAVLDRGLKKRYGGFMRRVGRPEWLVDNNNKNAGMMKRAWENGSGLQKRYGGFMD
ncbi:proenkephalin-A-like isoform X2 [Melanotaenia boesemani]|uniref:proenkephalin-A-like isoform X2 n=1 Tax=Melanotaenia boesemani TaxID=1250792 RepID=UPI001C05542F|nr:proenkephalin-A-like isoform X2 [Melanotaenia boesemani]